MVVVAPETGTERRVCYRHAFRLVNVIRRRVATANSLLNHRPWENAEKWQKGMWKPRGEPG